MNKLVNKSNKENNKHLISISYFIIFKPFQYFFSMNTALKITHFPLDIDELDFKNKWQ